MPRTHNDDTYCIVCSIGRNNGERERERWRGTSRSRGPEATRTDSFFVKFLLNAQCSMLMLMLMPPPSWPSACSFFYGTVRYGTARHLYCTILYCTVLRVLRRETERERDHIPSVCPAPFFFSCPTFLLLAWILVWTSAIASIVCSSRHVCISSTGASIPTKSLGYHSCVPSPMYRYKWIAAGHPCFPCTYLSI